MTTPAHLVEDAPAIIEERQDALDDRIDRAGEPMVVDEMAPAMYEVTTFDGSAYMVDIDGGACTCPDAQYGDAPRCKHALRATFEHIADELHASLPDFEDFEADPAAEHREVFF